MRRTVKATLRLPVIESLAKENNESVVRQKGKITNWNDDKGFGFITPMGGGKQIFIHIKAFKNRSSRPEINQIVSFDLSKDKQGRVCAENASSIR